MPQRHRDPERRPEGAEAADGFARDIAEMAADLGDLVSWDDEDRDRDPSRDEDAEEMPPSGPGLRGAGGRGVGGFNVFPSTTAGPVRPVMTVVLPIRPGAGRPLEGLARRNRYYGLALRATQRWLRAHRDKSSSDRLELHIVTDAWPLCLLLPMVDGQSGPDWPTDIDHLDPFHLWHMWRRSGGLPFAGHVGPDAHSAFSALTRRHRVLNLEVRVKLCDRRRVVELQPFNGGAWPPGW